MSHEGASREVARHACEVVPLAEPVMAPAPAGRARPSGVRKTFAGIARFA